MNSEKIIEKYRINQLGIIGILQNVWLKVTEDIYF